MEIKETLELRGKNYGLYKNQASIAQGIKSAFRCGNWDALADDQKESLEMIANKIGRILNGNPNFHDSWHDIVGYAKLVADRLLLQAEGDK